MLICNINTLETVYSLNLTNHIILNGSDTLNLQKIVRIYRTFCKFITGFKNSTIKNLNS